MTATATPQVLADVCRGFAIDTACAIRTGFYRPNLTLIATPLDAAARDDALLHHLTSRPPGSSIVYVTLQRTAEEVASRLAAAGLPARAYHAGLPDAVRAEIQDWFAEAAHAVVVATIAFGMGIDKADIRAVYHYNLPKSLENLSQEIGRAGRDGLPAHCEMLVCPRDLNALENFIYGDTPALSSVHGLLQDLFGRGDEFDLSLYDLAAEHDIRQLVLNTLLTYLELDGYLEAGTPFYARYQFQPLCSSAEILARFSGERRMFLSTILAQAVKARTWFTIDLEKAATAAGAGRDRVVSALQYLEEQRLLTLKAEGVRNRYRRLRLPAKLDDLARNLHQRTLQRETREIDRLRQVLELAGHDGCLVSHLGEHFGEPLAQPCGHCSWCLNGHIAAVIPSRPAPTIDPGLRDRLGALRREHPDLFADPRTLRALSLRTHLAAPVTRPTQFAFFIRHARSGAVPAGCGVAGRLIACSTARTVAVDPVETCGTIATKIEVRLGGVFGMFQQFALEMTSAFADASSLEVALELPIAPFVLFHSGQTRAAKKGSPDRTPTGTHGREEIAPDEPETLFRDGLARKCRRAASRPRIPAPLKEPLESPPIP